MMEDVHRISRAVYYQVNKALGCREEIAMRRDRWDIEDIIRNIGTDASVLMTSGSIREGFHMKGSDYDFMIWPTNICVVHCLSQVNLQSNFSEIILLMEDQFTRPGFVLLRILSPRITCICCRGQILNVYIKENNRFYISSSRFRQAAFSPGTLRNATLHGPCTSGFLGNNEYDFANCYHSKDWPPQAFSFVERCYRKCWPSPPVLHSIIQSGCHFMAIGAKDSPTEFAEWRLSFSQAEYKLVYAMNHVQFLVYGLLKLFLKEALNNDIPDENKLLCSYFMKTVVFWKVQETVAMQWNINNFLFFFWKCYKQLMKWVYNEYCPNFFVPQNNIFYPKISGPRQQQLFRQMLDLYNEGLHCLLRCPSIHVTLYSALIHPQHPLTDTSHFSEFDHDLFLRNIVVGSAFLGELSDIRLPLKYQLVELLIFLLNKLKTRISQTQRFICYRLTVTTCQHLAFLLQINQAHEKNKDMYRSRKRGLRLMEVTSKIGCVADVLCLAIYLYNDGKYRQTLYLLQKSQSAMYRDYVMYTRVCKNCYMQAMGGQSMSTKIKLAMAYDIKIPTSTEFSELRLELRVIEEKPMTHHLHVSPFVLLQFLIFLCHHHLGNRAQQQQTLQDFNTLVYSDDGTYIKENVKDIAWQMLGICHQLSKNLYQALACYLEAQRYSPINDIKQLYRIKSVERQIHLS